MVVLIDTSVIIDALHQRAPFMSEADAVLRMCAEGKVSGYVAAHSVPNIFYVLRKHYPVSDLRQMLLGICAMLNIGSSRILMDR
jgi:predicted nucleic acid-binding protein